jgi:hypothetical protein
MVSGLVLAAACGSSVNQSGTGGGGGSGGTAGGGGEGGEIPPQCVVDTAEPGPYGVTFQFENGGASPAFLRQECALQYTIEACEDGYSAPLSIHAFCSQACSSSDGCIVCGACWLGSVPIDSGAQATDTWSGMRYTFGTTAEGCSCHDEHVARAGRYRIRVPVYDSDMAAQSGMPSYEVTKEFELPAPNGVVVVPIGQSP